MKMENPTVAADGNVATATCAAEGDGHAPNDRNPIKQGAAIVEDDRTRPKPKLRGLRGFSGVEDIDFCINPS